MLLQVAVNPTDTTSGIKDFFIGTLERGRFIVVVNFLLVGLVYFVICALINRFWIGSLAFLVVIALIVVAERLKLVARNETILPADLQLVGANTGNIAEFIPSGSGQIFVKTGIFITLCLLFFGLMRWLDGPVKLVNFKQLGIHIVVRVLVVIAPVLLIAAYASGLGRSEALAHKINEAAGDWPSYFDSGYDARQNGTIVGFLRLVNPKIMDEPTDYSAEKMQKISAKYSSLAQGINETRTSNLTDNIIIMILSESFSDPTRVPGVSLDGDPIPFIRSVKSSFPSGLMFSSGYGGGTANIEFEALTGLSLSNFDPSLTTPYQQLIPRMEWTPTFNQLWNGAGEDSIALHPYYSSMYSRDRNYKKFGFSDFWTLSEPDVISPIERLNISPYVSDKAAYQATLDKVKEGEGEGDTNFYQLVTIQNHMNYDGWYGDGAFKASGKNGASLTEYESQQINTYATGLMYTDDFTKQFLTELDGIDKPISVIFYGDHLPGIYTTASEDPKNSTALHETDYFIWSNAATAVSEIGNESAYSYSSPNYFMAQTAKVLNARVSPYLAFLTRLHEEVPALGLATRQTGERAEMLDVTGKQITPTALSAERRSLLEDYKLIQYDITAGEGYLDSLRFMQIE